MRLRYVGICNKGLVREKNQDAILLSYKEKQDMAMFVVADGMGGHSNGELASRKIVEKLKIWCDSFTSEKYQNDFRKMLDAIHVELMQVNRDIFNTYNEGSSICGSTCSLLFVYHNMYAIISVGDSHIYRKRKFTYELMTKDDVWENRRDVREAMTENSIRNHPNYGKLVHAVGVSNKLNVSMKTDEIKKNDLFLLCTDGLYKYVPMPEIKKKLRFTNGQNISFRGEELLKMVFDAGAIDNVSFIIVKA